MNQGENHFRKIAANNLFWKSISRSQSAADKGIWPYEVKRQNSGINENVVLRTKKFQSEDIKKRKRSSGL